MEINIANNDNNQSIVIYLESHIDGNGCYITPYNNETSSKIAKIENYLMTTPIGSSLIYVENNVPAQTINPTNNISTEDEVRNHFADDPGKYFISGLTDSKFSLLDLSYTKQNALQQFNASNPTSIGKSLTQTSLFIPPKVRTGQRIEISGTNVIGMILTENDNRKEYVLYLDTPNPIFYVDNPDGTTIFKFMRTADNVNITPSLSYYSDTVDEPKVLSEVFIDRGVNNAFEPMKKLKNVKDLNELIKTGFGYYKINTRGYNFKDQ